MHWVCATVLFCFDHSGLCYPCYARKCNFRGSEPGRFFVGTMSRRRVAGDDGEEEKNLPGFFCRRRVAGGDLQAVSCQGVI